MPEFPDAVSLARDWLTEHLEVPVFVKVLNDKNTPQGRQPKFVQMHLVGGRQHNLVMSSPRVEFDAWAPTKSEAHDLAQEVHWLMRMLPQQGGVVRKVVVMGDVVDMPDPLTASERFKFVMHLHTRGEPRALAGS
jgi:hypothetical protein